MEIFSTSAPLWVAILFLAVIWIPTFLIARLSQKGAVNAQLSNPNRIFWIVILFYSIYLLYVSIACIQGYFAAATLPPRILIFTMIPLLVFLMLVIFNLPTVKKILRNITLADMVRLHIFRLIGSFFIILYLFKALPPTIAWIAGTGDIITALSSLYVANAIEQKKSFARPLTLAWNTFGLLDIVATSSTAFILTKLSIETGSQGVDTLAEFPFCFIPAFAPATIIFLHFCIYRKLFWTKP